MPHVKLGLGVSGRHEAGGGSTEPTDPVTGLLANWDFGDASTITESSNLISQINDKVGSRHLTASGTQRPTYSAVNGSSTFDGSANIMWNSAPFMYANGSITFVAVMRSDGGNNRYLVSERHVANSPPQYAIGVTNSSNANDDMYQYIRNDANNVRIDNFNHFGVVAFNDVKNIVVITDSGTALNAYVNGALGASCPNTYTRSGSLTLDTFALCGSMRSTPGSLLAAEIFEIRVYDHALNGTEVAALTAFLEDKYSEETPYDQALYDGEQALYDGEEAYY